MNSPPVLFLIFNRPELTAQVFERIRAARPARLFVAADGPRANKPGEALRCREARRVIDAGVDWDCQVERLYRTENLGCRVAVSSAIDWYFEHVEEGIILEDDCLPDPTFFRFCGELLERYRADPRVHHVGGFNPATAWSLRTRESYQFWHFGSIWGWATWRRAWKNYDLQMSGWPEFERAGTMREFCMSDDEARERVKPFSQTHGNAMDTWDFQWAFARLNHHGLSITPHRNLIANVGFGVEATHTHDKADARALIGLQSIEFPLVHPAAVAANSAFGAEYWCGIKGGAPAGATSLMGRVVRKLRQLWQSASTPGARL